MKSLVLGLLFVATAACAGEPLTLLSWNVESGGADPAVIAEQLAELPRAAVYVLQEVNARDIGRYGNAIRDSHGPSYRFVGSWTGQGDRLLFVFDDSRLTLLETRELYASGEQRLNDWRHRSPLACRFRDRATGETFFVVTVHLARGNEDLRASQALGLSAWATEVQAPAIAVGDFNFDFEFGTEKGNQSWERFKDAGIWKWARPSELVDTNWSDRTRDGVDDYPDSCLDFAYYASLPADWRVTSEVIVRPGDFPDDNRTSDHRPLLVKLTK